MINKDDERVVLNCPLCGKHTLNVFKKENEMMQCLSCGYSTNSQYKYKEDKTDNEYYSGLDPSMKRWSLEANDFIWLPSILTFDAGMLYPIDVKNEMKWSFAPMVEIPEDERKNFPNEQGGFYERKIDTDNPKIYDEFILGMSYLNDLMKKYELDEIVTGDSIFCATGITSGDLVAGIEIQGNDFVSETLVTHKSSGLKTVIKLKQNLQ